MHRTHQRRQQRVAYAASVRLHPSGRPHPFEGRSINLSRSGVLVESLQPCAVGTDLVCEIPLPGGRRQLRGRVARMQALSPAAVGLAIEFTGLAPPDEDLLSEVVGEDDGRSRTVQVRFEGMREPMRSRAQLTDDGIRFSTALPFLRLRSSVEVTFLSGRSQIHSRGVVRDVELDRFGSDGTPRLAVSVAFPTESEAQPVPAAPVNTPVPAEIAPPQSIPVSAPARLAPAAPEPAPAPPAEPRNSGGMPVLRMLAVAAGVTLVGLAALSYHRAAAPPSPHVQLQGPPVAPPAKPPVAQPPVVAVVPTAIPPAKPAAPLPPPAPAPLPPPPAVVIPAPLPAGTPGPTLETDGDETTALVPVTGSTGKMAHYSLSHPRGLAVNLPLAQSVLPIGLHTIGRDGLRYVWIRERPSGGLQIRFIFTSPPPDERLLELDEDAVKIRVRHHAAAVAGAENDGVVAQESDATTR